MATRYLVQRAATGEVLTREAPILSRDDLETQLSSVGSVKLTVAPATVTTTAADGLPLFVKRGTLISIVEDDQISFRGLLHDMTYNGPDWVLEVPSIATLPHNTYYEGPLYYGIQVDPADLVRRVWNHVQSFPDSDLGVTVVGSTSVRIGSKSTQDRLDATAAAAIANRQYQAENTELQRLKKIAAASRKDYQALTADRVAKQKVLTAAKGAKPKDQAAIDRAQNILNAADAAKAAQDRVIDGQQATVNAQAKIVADAKQAKDAAGQQKTLASRRESADGGAYRLFPWEAPDCGRLIDDLAKDTPFDWVEQHYWDGDTPATRIAVMYPRAGRRLNQPGDPTFQQGVNISKPLVVTDTTDTYANSVYGVGAGEGVGAIRRSITRRDGRVRTVAKFSSKDVKSDHNMDVKLRVELTARQETLRVAQVTVRQHENSPRGSYGVGDDIFVQGRVRHLGKFQLWHRITAITEKNDGTSVLTLARTDSFTYGKGLDE